MSRATVDAPMTDPTREAPAGEASAAALSPEDALRTMARVTANTAALRVRTEGLTIVLWGIVMAASYLTIVVPILGGMGGPGPGGPGPRGPPPSTSFFAQRYAPLAWYAVGFLVTLAIWRSASLSFQTGLTTPRLVATFAAWLALFLATVVLLTYVNGGNPRSWHLFGWAIVLGLLAALNPLRFTKRSRVAIGVVAASALATGAYAQLADLPGRDVGFLSGVALGVPALIAGLALMLRG